MIDQTEFDALLAKVFSPPARSADLQFVARVDAALAEVARFRAWRRRALRRLGSEVLVLVGLAGSALIALQAPGAFEHVASAPMAIPALAGSVLVVWVMLSAPTRRTLP